MGVFAPSEPITPARWKRLGRVTKQLKSHGFDVTFSPNIRAATGSTAGSIEARVSALSTILQDSSVQALCGAWGGRGCIELLEKIDYAMFAEKRKPILGVSDIAVLLNAITARTGLITFFGPNVYGKLDEVPIDRLRFLFEHKLLSKGSDILAKASGSATIHPGVVTGKLFGGSLDTFVHANAGTNFCLPPRGNIFLWETSLYDPQKIRQQIYSLRLRKVFENLGGMIIGHIGVRPPKLRWPTPHKFPFLSELLADLSIPILYAPVFGHGKHLHNPVFPLGAKATLDAGKGTLVLGEPTLEVE